MPVLDMLQRVLTLRRTEDLDAVIALDFYYRPAVNGELGLTPTSVGSLVNAVKYQALGEGEVSDAGRRLTALLSDVVMTHPWYRSIDLVLAVPGHDPAQLATSVRIGVTVAGHARVPCISPKSRRPGFRKSAKKMTDQERAELLDCFVVERDLSGLAVLVVDDVFHTGYTMRSVARAARLAGASTVLGLTAARNWRR
ncbi:phosphoribosyltransferase [Amycolatopsis sp. NPDC051102]|uniref:ComF family protein n=1 Tax=Amycolatopsis sp. NPDC051102 TaxID=3155163 RepID=UPI0034444CAC